MTELIIAQESTTPRRLLLLHCADVDLHYSQVNYRVRYCDSGVRISLDDDNYQIITLKNQQVSYKATILGGYSQEVEVVGSIEFKELFIVNWEDEKQVPELIFLQPPNEIRRKVPKGKK